MLRKIIPPKRDKRHHGTVTLEAAIVFPLLLIICLGVIEYGWMFLKAHQITNAARNGCRLAIRDGATNGEVMASISTLMKDARITGYTVEIVNAAVGQPVQVHITVPYRDTELNIMPLSQLFRLLKLELIIPENLSARVAMAKEGP